MTLLKTKLMWGRNSLELQPHVQKQKNQKTYKEIRPELPGLDRLGHPDLPQRNNTLIYSKMKPKLTLRKHFVEKFVQTLRKPAKNWVQP